MLEMAYSLTQGCLPEPEKSQHSEAVEWLLGQELPVLRSYLKSTELHQNEYMSPKKQNIACKTTSTQTPQYQRTFVLLLCVFCSDRLILPLSPI